MDDTETSDSGKGPGLIGTVGAGLGIILSTVYLLNFTMGVIEIPDNLPIIGNLDEAGATWLLITCLRILGFDITAWFSRNKPKRDPDKSAGKP